LWKKQIEDNMAVNLSNLKPPRGSRHRKVRVGRGIGSKLGRTAGKGNKGQKSRKGYSRRPGFEGGQMPLRRRIPKRGFHNPTRFEYAVVNVEMLNGFAAGETVTPELLRATGLIRELRASIKVLGDGDLKTSLTVRAHKFSKSAEEKITQAGGKVEILP
jgi:large subunit ribosomal protein L15